MLEKMLLLVFLLSVLLLLLVKRKGRNSVGDLDVDGG
jgi:hypothetical protein